MTAEEKKEIAELIKTALAEAPEVCPNGITRDETAYLRELASAFKHGKRALIAAVAVALVGSLLTAIGVGIRVMLSSGVKLYLAVGAALLLVAAGCAAYQSQTTVFGVEVAYNPTESAVPTARAGLITHRQNAVSGDRLWRMKNAISYYDLSVWSGNGTLNGELAMEAAE